MLCQLSSLRKPFFCLWVIINRFPEVRHLSVVRNRFTFLDELLQLNSGGVEHLLRELHSVLEVRRERLYIRHKSFSDFLTCKTRSGGHYIDTEIVRGEVLGLLWATIPRCLNQFARLPDPLSLRYYSPLQKIIENWRLFLPAGRHARATIQELANIADFLEKNDNPHERIIELYLGKHFSDFYPFIISWLSKEKLDEQNPILWKQYISLYDKDMLLLLKQFEFLDPIHSIHFLAFKLPEQSTRRFSYLSMPRHVKVFLNFFLDPSRSGKYHLTPQHHADIAGWMIQYYYPLPKGIFTNVETNRSTKP